MFEVDESNINFVKESPELNFDSITQKENDLKYLNYVDEMHNRINSRSFGEEQIDHESSSDIYSEHRLRSTSSERQSTIKLEETQGKTYVIKKIDERNTVKIPQLNLDNIIESQKKKMYPFNLNQEGEIIEVEKPDSSMGTHNDEDAFIYDEQDQEESSSLLNEEVNENKKYSNLFENSFFSDLSSVKKSKNEEKFKEKEINEITKGKPKNGKDKLILIGDISNSSIRNSFLDQEINMDSMLIDHNDEEISIISKENSKSNVNILKEALSIEKLNNNQSNNYIFSPEKHRKDQQNFNEIRQNNFMRTDSNESIDRLDNFLKNSNGLQIFKNSRDKNVNILNDKDSKAKSVPADGRNINEDHITFGHHGYDMNDESESIMKNFEWFNAQKDAIHQDKEDDFKNRNKSVVIPRSSILLKNKKNINKRNLEPNCLDNIRQNNSVSPPKINETSSKFSKMVHDENDYKSNEKKFWGKLQFKDQNRAKFNFMPNNIVLKNEGNSINMNDNANKKTNKIKLMRNKIVPFKIIKSKKFLLHLYFW